MRSFTTRFTLLYVAIAALLLMTVTLVSTATSVVAYAGMLNMTVGPAAERSSRRMTEALARGASFGDAAASVVRDFDHPLMRVVIYDERHRAVAASADSNSRNLAHTAFVEIAKLCGLRSAKQAIPGGMLIVSADTGTLGGSLIVYWARSVPFGLLIIGIAFLFGRAVTRHAMLPIARVTAALRSFANGGFAPQAVMAAQHEEFAALADAYRDAAVATQRAFEAREEAQVQMQQFIANAGHELRTPLTVVMGYVDALRDGIVLDPARVMRAYDNMGTECRRMRALIEKLIYLARLDETKWPSANPAPVDVVALARQVVDELVPLAPSLALTASADASDAVVIGDPSELREAIVNVVNNALRYAPGAPIEIAIERVGSQLRITIIDCGPGMSADDRAHAFDRFYRGSTRGAIEGAGLGLAIAKRAVERMNGTVTLWSEVGRGTKVTIGLPRAESAALRERRNGPIAVSLF